MLNTILDRFVILWNAPKNWSLDGGLIWLVFMMVGFVVLMATIPAISHNKK